MNTKQKMIEAMYEAHKNMPDENPISQDDYFGGMLDAALAVLADPENWTEELDEHVTLDKWMTGEEAIRAVINHVREQEPKP